MHAFPHLVPLLQLMSQEMPLHVAAPLPDVGLGHWTQSGPQESRDTALLHVPSQSFVPNGHTQRPELQPFPPLQRLPQEPQLLSSLFVSTHVEPQSFVGDGHMYEHSAFSQIGWAPLTFVMHGEHSVPQVASELSSEHLPLQSCVPCGHAQLPDEHIMPPVQALSQAPQCWLSVMTSTHALPQSVGVAAGQPEEQPSGPAQTGVPPLHAVVQSPQCSAVLMSVSQPNSKSMEQLAHPAAHAEPSNSHLPSGEHVTEPLTFGNNVQS
jgi:hypothetical protein